MMNYDIEIICNSLLCLGALIGFIYSLVKFFKPRKALYKKMVGCALGCLFIERLYEIVQYVIAGDLPQIFQIGTFGNIGCYMFLFSANYGAIDWLFDDGSPQFKKYRLAALAAPLVTVIAAIIILLSPSGPGRKITCAIEMLFVGASAYYSLKHLILPKETMDFMSGIKVFHAASLLLAAGTVIEDIIWCYQVQVQAVWYIPYAILFISMLALAPAMERGTEKWKA